MIQSEEFFSQKLKDFQKASALRELREPCGLDYCSNDYLGLAQNNNLQSRIGEKLKQSALGSSGSRLVRGHSSEMAHLEEKLAQFSNQSRALFFSSGYQTNLALFSCLLKHNAVVFSDELNHASIIDGIRLAGCEKYIWGHNDLGDLKMMLKQKAKSDKLNVVIVESLYSMRGDQAPLKEIIEICQEYGAELVVDEAHATGLFGQMGSGLVEAAGLSDHVLATIHTAGKSLGVSGAWIAGNHSLIEYLINRSRPFIYTTAPAFYQQMAVTEALNFYLENQQQLIGEFFDKLYDFQNSMKESFPQLKITGRGGPVTSLVLGENTKALSAMEKLRENGFDVRAIRPPTVPQGEALLRITHPLPRTKEEDQSLVAALKEHFNG